MATMFDNPLGLLRQLKGAPLSVFLACQIVRQVVSHDWLCQQTGYSDHAVTRALAYLTEHNFLARVTGGWMIASAAQLPLMAVLPDGEETVIENDFHKNRVKRDSCPVDVVVVESEESLKNKSTTTTSKNENRVKRDFGSQPTTRKEPAEVKSCLDALRELKIYGKKAERVAKDEYVAVEDIRAHWHGLQGETWDNPQGMLIYLLENHVPVPECNDHGHPVDCRCYDCKIKKLKSRVSVSDDYESEDE